MNSTTIILDTNILFSGLYSSKGASFKVLKLIESKIIKPVISTTLLFEYEDILRRKQEELILSNSEIDSILDNICGFSSFQKIYFLWIPCLKDPKDDHVLEVAVASKTKVIITYNHKDFIGADKFGVKVISPKTLLETLI